jgi:large subunit ribosomal protein L18
MKKTLKKRRKQNKTDYSKRLNLLKSGKPRVIFRRTNNYIITQYIKSKEAKDKIILGFTSKDLIKYGWPKNAQGSLKSISASYLTGFLIGKKILKEKLETPIADLGMIKTLYKTRVYGFLKGLINSGLKINCDEKCFPEEMKIKGENLKNKIEFDKIKDKIK